MPYLSYTSLLSTVKDEAFNRSLYFHRNKIKLRLFNTNEEFASVPALLDNTSRANYSHKLYNNISILQTDYIDGKRVPSSKVDLIVNPIKESKENLAAILILLEITHSIPPNKLLNYTNFLKAAK